MVASGHNADTSGPRSPEVLATPPRLPMLPRCVLRFANRPAPTSSCVLQIASSPTYSVRRRARKPRAASTRRVTSPECSFDRISLQIHGGLVAGFIVTARPVPRSCTANTRDLDMPFTSECIGNAPQECSVPQQSQFTAPDRDKNLRRGSANFADSSSTLAEPVQGDSR